MLFASLFSQAPARTSLQHKPTPTRRLLAVCTMIRGVIIVNNHGKPRLVKFYQTVVSTAISLQLRVVRSLCSAAGVVRCTPLLPYPHCWPLCDEKGTTAVLDIACSAITSLHYVQLPMHTHLCLGTGDQLHRTKLHSAHSTKSRRSAAAV